MTVAAWQANHAYTAGNIVNPTTANGHSYISIVGGTSGMTEPTWSGRWPAVTDGVANTWAPYSIITPATVRSQLKIEGSTDQWTDTIIGNYILDAISSLEQATQRYIVNRPGATIVLTSMNRAQVAIPGLRTPTTVTQYGGPVIRDSGYYLLPDAMQSGVFTSIQFRTFRVNDRMPWWIGNPNWFDMNLDSPFYPANYAGYSWTSLPNDTSIVGDWGWEPLFEPGAAVHAVEVLAEFFCLRPAAILADSVITPQGGIVSYAAMPPEVQEFVRWFSTGTTAVSIG